MKHIIFLTGLLMMAFGQVDSFAQDKKVVDDIYYTAEDAAKDAEAEAKERDAIEAARKKRAEERGTGNYSNDGGDEYIDYDDDEYYYANRFNRFNGPYYGNSYWAYDPFWGNPWYGGGWGWGPGWGMSFGYGYGPYWSAGWGYSNWYGYPGFYSAWNSPYYGGWGGYYNGYYNGFYNGYYSGAYDNGGGINYRPVTYGPRSSINRYPGSLRSSGSGSTTGYGSRGQLREAGGTSENRNYSGRNTYSEPVRNSGNYSNERRATGSDRGNATYENRQNATVPATRESRNNTPRENRVSPEPRYQQRSEPAYQRSTPSYQNNSAPSRSYSSPGSSPSRGGSFGGGSRSSGGSRSGGSRGR